MSVAESGCNYNSNNYVFINNNLQIKIIDFPLSVQNLKLILHLYYTLTINYELQLIYNI